MRSSGGEYNNCPLTTSEARNRTASSSSKATARSSGVIALVRVKKLWKNVPGSARTHQNQTTQQPHKVTHRTSGLWFSRTCSSRVHTANVVHDRSLTDGHVATQRVTAVRHGVNQSHSATRVSNCLFGVVHVVGHDLAFFFDL